MCHYRHMEPANDVISLYVNQDNLALLQNAFTRAMIIRNKNKKIHTK